MALSPQESARVFVAGKTGERQPNHSAVMKMARAAVAAAKEHHRDAQERREIYEAGKSVGDEQVGVEEALSRYRAEKTAKAHEARQRKSDRIAMHTHNAKGVVLEARGAAEKTGATMLLPFGLTAGAVGGIFKGAQWALNKLANAAGNVGDAGVGLAARNIGMYNTGEEHALSAFGHYDEAKAIHERLNAGQTPSRHDDSQPEGTN